jgi:hypothetical protein
MLHSPRGAVGVPPAVSRGHETRGGEVVLVACAERRRGRRGWWQRAAPF